MNGSSGHDGSLMSAVQSGMTHAVREVLQRGHYDLSERDSQKQTALHIATIEGYYDIVDLLLKYRAEVDSRADEDDTPLHWAARHGHVDIARLLVENGADLEARGTNQFTPLHWALFMGLLEPAEMLIAAGADVTAKDRNGKTAVHLATQVDLDEVIPKLVEGGVDVNKEDIEGETALYLAMEYRCAKTGKRLMALGAEVNSRGGMTHGQVPLHSACRGGRRDHVEFLLEVGADVNARDNLGQTALHVSIISNKDVVQVLIDHGADVSLKDNQGHTALIWAAYHGAYGHIQLLLQHGARAGDKDAVLEATASQHLALRIASGHKVQGDIEALKLLIQHEDDINQCGCWGATTLDILLCSEDRTVSGSLVRDVFLPYANEIKTDKSIYSIVPSYLQDTLHLHTTASALVSKLTYSDLREFLENLTSQRLKEFLSAKNFLNQTPVQVLFCQPSFKIECMVDKVKLLIQMGSDPQHVDFNGQTVYHLAALHHEQPIWEILPEEDATTDAVGKTPEQYAKIKQLLDEQKFASDESEDIKEFNDEILNTPIGEMRDLLKNWGSSTIRLNKEKRGDPDAFVHSLFNTKGLGVVESNKENEHIRAAMTDLISGICAGVGKRDPRFYCEPRPSGSAGPEATKVGKFNEMDFVVYLHTFMKGHEIHIHDRKESAVSLQPWHSDALGKTYLLDQDQYGRDTLTEVEDKYDRTYASLLVSPYGDMSAWLHPTENGLRLFSDFWHKGRWTRESEMNFKDEVYISHFWKLFLQELSISPILQHFPLTVETCVRRSGFVGTLHLIWHGQEIQFQRVSVDVLPACVQDDWIVLMRPRYWANTQIGHKAQEDRLQLSGAIRDRKLLLSMGKHVVDGYRVAKMMLNLFGKVQLASGRWVQAADIVQSYLLKTGLFWLLDPYEKYDEIYKPSNKSTMHLDPRLHVKRDFNHYSEESEILKGGTLDRDSVIYCRACEVLSSSPSLIRNLPRVQNAPMSQQYSASDDAALTRASRIWALRIYQMVRFIIINSPRLQLRTYFIPLQEVKTRDRRLAVRICNICEALLSD